MVVHKHISFNSAYNDINIMVYAKMVGELNEMCLCTTIVCFSNTILGNHGPMIEQLDARVNVIIIEHLVGPIDFKQDILAVKVLALNHWSMIAYNDINIMVYAKMVGELNEMCLCTTIVSTRQPFLRTP
jgi:hypothetical protein